MCVFRVVSEGVVRSECVAAENIRKRIGACTCFSQRPVGQAFIALPHASSAANHARAVSQQYASCAHQGRSGHLVHWRRAVGHRGRLQIAGPAPRRGSATARARHAPRPVPGAALRAPRA